MHLRGEEGGDHGDDDEKGQEDEGQTGVTVREQHRYRNDRAELANGAHRQDGGPDRRVQHLGVVQDGQERAERRRGQAEGHDDVVEHQPRGAEDDSDGQREHQRRPPRAHRSPEVALAHDGEIELGAGQEHQIGQPEIRQRRHEAVRVGQVEHVGAEQDPEDDLDHDLGYGDEPARPFGDDRRKDRRQPDEDQRGNRSFFDHVSSLRPATARRGTPRHLRGHTLRATCPEPGDSGGLTARRRWGSMARPTRAGGLHMRFVSMVFTRPTATS